MLNVLRPRVRSSTGCLLKGHSSYCAPDDVSDPEDIHMAGRKWADGYRLRGRVQQHTPALLQVSHLGHRRTGPLAGGSWNRPLVCWFFQHHMSQNTKGSEEAY